MAKRPPSEDVATTSSICWVGAQLTCLQRLWKESILSLILWNLERILFWLYLLKMLWWLSTMHVKQNWLHWKDLRCYSDSNNPHLFSHMFQSTFLHQSCHLHSSENGIIIMPTWVVSRLKGVLQLPFCCSWRGRRLNGKWPTLCLSGSLCLWCLEWTWWQRSVGQRRVDNNWPAILWI